MIKIATLFLILLLSPSPVLAQEILAKRVDEKISVKSNVTAELFNNVPEQIVALMWQPMIIPQPKTTTTPAVKVQAIHDGKWLALRLRWADKEKSEAGKLGEYSDAVAVQFPVVSNTEPPPVFMGIKDNPVHIFHWRAQYQLDAERGRRDMKDLYPNMNPDMYPMEFKDSGNLKGLTEEQREQFSTGRAAGNPQAYVKTGVDEIIAEGFSTSAVQGATQSYGFGEWKDDEWTVYIIRAMQRQGGSSLQEGNGSFAAFAVWQGGLDEIGARKCVTMLWTPLKIEGVSR